VTDERRERYATAMYEQMYPGHAWADVARTTDSFPPMYRGIADAAIAVADEEQQKLRAKLYEWQGSYLDEVKVRQERDQANDRLRAELEQLRDRAADLEEQVIAMGGHQLAAEEHAATLARVRAALDYCDRGSAIALRAALGDPATATQEEVCTECGHPKGEHQDADEPVSVGLCTVCDEDGSDDAWHNYDPAKEA
jgi:septal ring factor EnvC (AmiA/AmiB activator)